MKLLLLLSLLSLAACAPKSNDTASTPPVISNSVNYLYQCDIFNQYIHDTNQVDAIMSQLPTEQDIPRSSGASIVRLEDNTYTSLFYDCVVRIRYLDLGY